MLKNERSLEWSYEGVVLDASVKPLLGAQRIGEYVVVPLSPVFKGMSLFLCCPSMSQDLLKGPGLIHVSNLILTQGLTMVGTLSS